MLSAFASRLYVRIHPDLVVVRDVGSGDSLSEPPLLAISAGGKREVLAVGAAATRFEGQFGVDIRNPFEHVRMPLADDPYAELLVKTLVARLQARRIIALAPTIVMHLAVEQEDGVTRIETRALRALGLGAGARQVHVWQGPDLHDEEVRRLRFPPTGTLS